MQSIKVKLRAHVQETLKGRGGQIFERRLFPSGNVDATQMEVQ